MQFNSNNNQSPLNNNQPKYGAQQIFNTNNTTFVRNPERTQDGYVKYIAKTYLWMFFGLAISFGLAFVMYANSGTVENFLDQNALLYIGSVVAEVILIIALSVAIRKIPATVAKVLFLAYAALFGVTLTPILLMYELESTIMVLAITSLIYLLLAVVGLTTKKDMSKFGSVLVVGLIGLLIYSAISFFFIHSDLNDILVGLVGLALFMGFTIYDSNKIKKYYLSYQGNGEMLEKTCAVSALQLYLDYVNMFIRILALVGKRN